MSPRSERPVWISGGFCLLTAWFAAVNGWRLLLVVLGAAAVHELGHCLMLKCLGVPIKRLCLTVFGAALETGSARLSYGRELAAVLAGPAANLLCVITLAPLGERWTVFIGANLVLCVFNLLPVRPLDGGMALYLLVSWIAGPAAGEWAARWLGALTAALLAAGVGYVMWSSCGSLWLLPAAVGLLAAAGRECLGRSAFL